MTYGQIRLRLTQLVPAAYLAQLDGWIQDVYTEVLDSLPWKRSEGEITIQAPIKHATGTVAVTQGSASIVGTTTAWTAGMNGRAIRFDNSEEFYQLTVTNATAATLDRPYEGPTAAAATYRIDQPIYVLPENARIVRQVMPLHDGTRPLELVTPAELDRRFGAQRNAYGTPTHVSAYWDNFSNPPRMQLDFAPIPECLSSTSKILSWSVDYVFDREPLNPRTTSFSMLPWVRPSILIEGVMAKCRRHEEKLNVADAHLAEFARLLQDAAQINAAQRGPQTMRLAPELQFRKGENLTSGPRPWSKNFDQLVDD